MALTRTEEIEQALALVRSGSHLFLTGRAGTGKSTLVREIAASTDRTVVLAAPTGVAALNVEGLTVHRLFGLRPTSTPATVRSLDYHPGRFARLLAGTDTLVIDEASMLRADVLDMVAGALERFGPHPGRPFGGVQLVLVGDLFQLPPVVVGEETRYFETRYPSPWFFSADCFDPEAFPTVSLTRVFRQQGDARLVAVLNAIREGVLLEEAQRALAERTDPGFEPPEDELWLTLAPTNRLVSARNRERLARLPGPEVVSRAVRSGDLGGFDAPVADELRLKVGAQVMMLTNDPAGRWVNGTLGRVVWVEPEADGLVSAGVALADGQVVTVHPHTWDATRPVLEGGVPRREVVGSFTQLPCTLAWAVTIHKAQGLTLDRLVVDLTGGAFDPGQVYVALSRVTSLEGLVLTRPVRAQDLRTDRRVLRFLRTAGSPGRAERRCAVGVLTVGAAGRFSHPRPVEVAVAFEDGTAVSTLVNPQRDLGSARADYAIGTQDVLLAPTLAEAWAVLGPLLDGCTPVGVGTDHALGILDVELKRLGQVEPLPLGVAAQPRALLPAERAGLAAPSALERARTSLAVHRRTGGDEAGAGVFTAPPRPATGYLLSRDPDVPAPPAAPTLERLLASSRAMSEVVLGGVGAREVRQRLAGQWSAPGEDAMLREAVSARLAAAVERSAGLPPTLVARVRELEELLDTAILPPGLETADEPRAQALLVPGARVCFTGEVRDDAGRLLDKAALRALVTELGLAWAPDVTRTRCDVLVVAEPGTQSAKARKAKDYGTPVLTAAELLDWAEARRGKNRAGGAGT